MDQHKQEPCRRCGDNHPHMVGSKWCDDHMPSPLPLPGSTYHGRKVLAVVEGLVSQPTKRETGEAVMIWPKDDAPGPIITPVTVVILKREEKG